MPETAETKVVAKAAHRFGVPVWRTAKPDAVLAAAVEVAKQEILSIAKPDQLGSHLAVRSEGERVATHLFECTKDGYRGWQWFAVVTRAPRTKIVTVSEVGLLPTDDSVLAPEWLPWSERVRPEDEAAAAEKPQPADSAVQAAEAEPVLPEGSAPEFDDVEPVEDHAEFDEAQQETDAPKTEGSAN
ncbi:DUF3027 domain-containing protein [Psychromicrobium sp. YIM B11713]|uniref:DUF3027 domain-containing protein n=1 Tax=Psychromicrobium sp. YIM B11713 TaxID=3145233 RepID=UPI00374E94B0